MKKLILVIVALLLLSSCSISQQDDKTPISTSVNTLLNTVVVDNSLYQIKPNVEKNGSNIIYTDLAEKKTIYLCNNPSCLHVDETCTSFMNSYDGFITYNEYTNKLILSDHFFIDGNYITKLYSMDCNGENRKEIYTLNSNEFFSLPMKMAEVDEKLYYIINKADNSNEQITLSQYLLEININTNQSKIVYNFKETSELIGAVNNNLYYLNILPSQDCLQYEIKIIEHNLSEDTVKYVYTETITGDNIPTIKCYDKNIYFAYSENGVGYIRKYNLESNSSEIIINDIDIKGARKLSFDYIDNDYLIFNTVIPDNNGLYSIPRKIAINLNTFTVNELTLQIKGEDPRTFFVGLIGIYKDYFIVVNTNKVISTEYFDISGNIYKQNYTYSLYSLIKKDDYINNKDVYISLGNIFMSETEI